MKSHSKTMGYARLLAVSLFDRCLTTSPPRATTQDADARQAREASL